MVIDAKYWFKCVGSGQRNRISNSWVTLYDAITLEGDLVSPICDKATQLTRERTFQGE